MNTEDALTITQHSFCGMSSSLLTYLLIFKPLWIHHNYCARDTAVPVFDSWNVPLVRGLARQHYRPCLRRRWRRWRENISSRPKHIEEICDDGPVETHRGGATPPGEVERHSNHDSRDDDEHHENDVEHVVQNPVHGVSLQPFASVVNELRKLTDFEFIQFHG